MRIKQHTIITVFSLILLLSGCGQKESKQAIWAPSEMFQLGDPYIALEQTLFLDSTKVRLYTPNPKATLFYQLSSISDTSLLTEVYKEAFYINSTTALTVQARHSDFIDSELVYAKGFRRTISLEDTQIKISPPAHPSYSGLGPKSLIDQSMGSTSFRNSTDWLGFDKPEITIDLNLKKKTVLKKISLNSLIDQSAWIFGPAQISLYENGKLIAFKDITGATQKSQTKLASFVLDLPEKEYQQLRIKIKTVSNIPTWHDGVGSQAWLFLDQILID